MPKPPGWPPKAHHVAPTKYSEGHSQMPSPSKQNTWTECTKTPIKHKNKTISAKLSTCRNNSNSEMSKLIIN